MLTLKCFIRDEKGLAAVEYGLLAAGIAVGLWLTIGDIKTALGNIFTNLKTDLSSASTSSNP